jgi:glycosyltransferase involved in cell wall biosynthesis
MAHISVVIPVYKAEDCLHELHNRLKNELEKITNDFEILFIEDCGGDRSWEIIVELASLDPRIKGFQFSRNFGQHYGITAGLDYCNGDWIVVMDCDLQDRPEEIQRLYEVALEGYDIVLARRKNRSDHFLKRFTSWAYYKVFNYLSDIDYDGEIGNFRIMSRNVVNSFCTMRENLRFFGGIINWIGFSSASVEIQHDQRFAGESSYTVKKLLKLAAETVIAYSDKPLRIAIRFGFFISFISFIYGGYIIYRALIHDVPIDGWSSLIVSMYFLSGIIIGFLGIIGIYLGKTFDEVKNRPLYIIHKMINLERLNRSSLNFRE